MILIYTLIGFVAAVCDSTCGSCHLPSGKPWECDSCVPGLFLQPEGGLCFNYCPSRYSAGAGVCSPGSQGVIVDYVFDAISASIADKAQGWRARNGATSAYFPGFEGTDPVPSKHRGYYFTGNSYLLLPPLSGSADPRPLIGASASILTWLKTDVASGFQTVLSHCDPSNADQAIANILRLYLRNDLAVVLNSQTITLQGSALSLNTWYCITATLEFDSSTGTSTLKIYMNGAVDTVTSVTGEYLLGDVSAVTTIGMDYDLGSVPSDFFRGFMWEVKLWNYAISVATVQSHIVGSSPSSAAFPLSTCGQTFYDSGGSCLPCSTACAYGCIRNIDCYYCADSLCTNCNSFESSATCSACKFHATLVLGICTCDSGYYFLVATGSCDACYGACKTCTGPATTQCTSCLANAYLSAGSCLCSAGYFYPTATWTTCYVCVIQTATTKCYCPPGYYRATGANTCTLCGAFCNSDMTGTTDGCNKCFTSSQADHDVQESCYCSGSTFLPMGGSACQLCQSSCKKCDVAGASGCTECYGDSVLTPSPVGQCLCNGFHPAGSTSCVVCASTCLTCSGAAATDCTSCFPGSVLTASPGTCVCAGSFYRDGSGVCTSCQMTCATCSGGADSQCTFCMDDSYLLAGKCICSGSNYRQANNYCAPCHATCYRCSDNGIADCTSCFPDSTLTPSPTGQCLCNAGTYRPVDMSACLPCFKTCSTCVAGLQTDCSSCAADSYLSPSPTGECLCSGSNYRPPDFSPCLPCHNTCYRCGAATSIDCLSCYPDSTLMPVFSGSGSCLCNGSAYHSPASGICLPCDPTCFRCTSSTPTTCSSCYPDAYQLGTTCPCSGSFYRPAPSDACQPCYPECLTCSNGTPLSCTSCYPLAYLNSLAPGRCVCNDGYAGAPNTANCALCNKNCVTCLGLEEFHCTSCREGTHLVPEQIGSPHGWCRFCPESTYYNATSCASCRSGCRNCISSVHCTSCYSPLYLQPDFTCSATCPPPHDCTTLSSQCFSAFLLTRLGNNLSLAFTVNLSQPLSTSDFTLSFDFVEYSIGTIWRLKQIEANWSYILNVTYSRPVPAGSYATLRFKSPLRGANCETLASTEVNTGLVGVNATSAATSTWPLPQTVVLILLTSSILGGGTTLLWLIVNTFQLISYLPFSYIPMSTRTRKNLVGANMLKYIVNPFDYMGITSTSVPQYASNCDFDTALFLPNMGELMLTILSIGFSYLALIAVEFLGSKDLTRWSRARRAEYQWNVLIRLGLESYLPLLIAAGLQAARIQASVSSWICCLSALVAATTAIILPERSRIRLISLPKAPTFIRERWKELTDELTAFRQYPLGLFYNIFFCYRRLLYALIQLFLWNYPTVQGIINAAHSFWFLLYVAFLVRYPERRIHLASVTIEAGSTAIFLLVQVFYLEPNSEQSRWLDYAIFGVMAGMASVAVGVEMWRAGERLWQIATSRRTKMQVKKEGLRGTFIKRTIAKTQF